METTVVGVRVPVEDAKRFQEQAARFGLTKSTAGAALISGALAVDPQPERQYQRAANRAETERVC